MQSMIQFFGTLICITFAFNTQATGTFGSSFDALDIMPPEEAFVISQPALNMVQIAVSAGVYLYDDMTAILTLDDKVVRESARPRATMYDDPVFGPRPIHRGNIVITLQNPPKKAVLHYQGCADAGFCYPPMQTELLFSR